MCIFVNIHIHTRAQIHVVVHTIKEHKTTAKTKCYNFNQKLRNTVNAEDQHDAELREKSLQYRNSNKKSEKFSGKLSRKNGKEAITKKMLIKKKIINYKKYRILQ